MVKDESKVVAGRTKLMKKITFIHCSSIRSEFKILHSLVRSVVLVKYKTLDYIQKHIRNEKLGSLTEKLSSKAQKLI